MLNPEAASGPLTDLDRFVFESWGYLVIPDVLSAPEAAECYDASQRLHGVREREFGQIGRGYESEPALERLIDHPAVLPKVRGLFGDRFILQASWNTMQPAGGGVGGWHQDGSSAYNFNQVGYPVPLLQLRASFLLTDQTEPGAGNMELIPGSHRSQVPLPQDVRTNRGDVPIGQVICAPIGSVLFSTTVSGTVPTAMTGIGTATRRTTSTVRRGYAPPTGSPTRRTSWRVRRRDAGP